MLRSFQAEIITPEENLLILASIDNYGFVQAIAFNGVVETTHEFADVAEFGDWVESLQIQEVLVSDRLYVA